MDRNDLQLDTSWMVGEKRLGPNSETKMAFDQVYYVGFHVIVCPKTSEDLRICSHFIQTSGG
jgi:hypothetical protein